MVSAALATAENTLRQTTPCQQAHHCRSTSLSMTQNCCTVATCKCAVHLHISGVSSIPAYLMTNSRHAALLCLQLTSSNCTAAHHASCMQMLPCCVCNPTSDRTIAAYHSAVCMCCAAVRDALLWVMPFSPLQQVQAAREQVAHVSSELSTRTWIMTCMVAQ